MSGVDLAVSAVPVLERAAARCADALAAASFRDGARAGWVSWALSPDGRPTVARGGDATLYAGDAGAGWACLQLGAAETVPAGTAATLTALGHAALTGAAARAGTLDASLLAGSAGVALARGTVPPPVDPDSLPATDLTAGLAGVLLAQVRGGAGPDEIVATARVVQARAGRAEVGCCWTDPAPPGERARALCGLAHGAGGIALALAEAAARTGDGPIAATAGEALRWEGLWFDPLRGWPDLRTDTVTHPARWCHGAAGIGTVRLRVLELVRTHGLDVGIPAVQLQAEAQAAVGFCLDELEHAVAAGREHGAAAVPGGLTLCHGAGGPLDLLVSAAQAWSDDALLARARSLAAELVTLLDSESEDPSAWPAGLPQPGGASLLLGLAGVALVLARLVEPDLAAAGLLPGAVPRAG